MRTAVAACAGWVTGLVVFGVGMALLVWVSTHGIGPFAEALRGMRGAVAARGEEGVLLYLMTDEARDLMHRFMSVLVYATLPAACLAAACVASLIHRGTEGKSALAVGALATVAPLAFEWFVFPGAHDLLVALSVSTVVGVVAAVCASLLLVRRRCRRGIATT